MEVQDSDNNIYATNVKDKLLSNMIKINEECLNNILKFEEAKCSMEIFKEKEVIEVLPGILIFKNFYSNITHNCNKSKLKQKGNFIIKFENCKIRTLNITYSNVNIKIYDKIILPNIITKIKENENYTLDNIKIESLFMKQIKYDESLDQIMYHTNKTTAISFSFDFFIIICIVFIIVIHKK